MIELLVGLALAVCLAVAVGPFWVRAQSVGAGEADQTVSLLQGRVAIARLERDLRLAGAAGCPFAVAGPVLEASPSQVVFLERSSGGAAPVMVEWEIAGESLMRRWGTCPSIRPVAYAHSLYVDNKTMLEGLCGGAVFAYILRGAVVPAPVARADLASIEAVVIRLKASSREAGGPAELTTTARVGR